MRHPVGGWNASPNNRETIHKSTAKALRILSDSQDPHPQLTASLEGIHERVHFGKSTGLRINNQVGLFMCEADL